MFPAQPDRTAIRPRLYGVTLTVFVNPQKREKTPRGILKQLAKVSLASCSSDFDPSAASQPSNMSGLLRWAVSFWFGSKPVANGPKCRFRERG
jgi:hypothetical protein